VKQVNPAGRTVPPSVVPLTAKERGQLAGEVGPVVVTEVVPSAHSFVLAKRK